MELSSAIADRAAGVLVGQAVGDALGVPYEFAPPVRAGEAEMVGGGLGPYAPGEWSDDTQMSICIARVGASGVDVRSPAALDTIAEAFIDWKDHGASDIGNQTATVLDAASRGDGIRVSERMTAAAEMLAQRGQAGNGGLMRTSVVGLAVLTSADDTAEAATKVCRLTHAEPRCVESSVLWSLAVRKAVLTGELDIRTGLVFLAPNRRQWWLQQIKVAERRAPSTFTPNGFTVTALQAAWASIHSTAHLHGAEHVAAALQTAVSIGNDTDTVAAIAGGLLGAAYGVSQIPPDWVNKVHGWPGLRADDLRELAMAMASRE